MSSCCTHTLPTLGGAPLGNGRGRRQYFESASGFGRWVEAPLAVARAGLRSQAAGWWARPGGGTLAGAVTRDTRALLVVAISERQTSFSNHRLGNPLRLSAHPAASLQPVTCLCVVCTAQAANSEAEWRVRRGQPSAALKLLGTLRQELVSGVAADARTATLELQVRANRCAVLHCLRGNGAA